MDPIQIARLPENQREQQIRSILQMLFTLKEDQAFQALRGGVIETLAKRATDDEYINWCKTTMKILASYPDEVVKAGLALRSRVVSSWIRTCKTGTRQSWVGCCNCLMRGSRQKLMRNMK